MTTTRLQSSISNKATYDRIKARYIQASISEIRSSKTKEKDSMYKLIVCAESPATQLNMMMDSTSETIAEIIRLADDAYEDAVKSLKLVKSRNDRERALKLFLVWSLQMLTLIKTNSKHYFTFGNEEALESGGILANHTYAKLKTFLKYLTTLKVSKSDTKFGSCVKYIKSQLAAACEMVGFCHLVNGKFEQAIAYLTEEINLLEEIEYDDLAELCGIYILFAKKLCKGNDLKMAEFYLKKLKVLLANETNRSDNLDTNKKLDKLFRKYFSAIQLFIDTIIAQPSDDSFFDKLNIIQAVLRDEDLKSYTLKILFDRLKLMDFYNASLSALHLINVIKVNSINSLLKMIVADQQTDDKISGDDKISNDEKIPEDLAPVQPKVTAVKMEAPIADDIKPVSSTVPNINKLEVDDEGIHPSDGKIKVKKRGAAFKNNWSKEEITENNVMYGPLSQAETLGFNQSFASEMIYPITSNEFPDGRYYGYYSRENTHPKQVSESTHQQAINTLVSGRVGYKSPSIKLVKNRNNNHSDNVAFKLAPLCDFRMFGRKVDEMRDAHGNVIRTLIAFDIPANHTSQKKMY